MEEVAYPLPQRSCNGRCVEHVECNVRNQALNLPRDIVSALCQQSLTETEKVMMTRGQRKARRHRCDCARGSGADHLLGKGCGARREPFCSRPPQHEPVPLHLFRYHLLDLQQWVHIT